MSGVRRKPVHPVIQRCLDAAGAMHISETALRAGESREYVYKLADPETLDGFIERMERWARAVGVPPEQFLSEVSRYITETRQISTEQSKTAI